MSFCEIRIEKRTIKSLTVGDKIKIIDEVKRGYIDNLIFYVFDRSELLKYYCVYKYIYNHVGILDSERNKVYWIYYHFFSVREKLF